MNCISEEDVLRVVTENLDRINGTSPGVMKGVAHKWFVDVERIVIDEEKKQ